MNSIHLFVTDNFTIFQANEIILTRLPLLNQLAYEKRFLVNRDENNAIKISNINYLKEIFFFVENGIIPEIIYHDLKSLENFITELDYLGYEILFKDILQFFDKEYIKIYLTDQWSRKFTIDNPSNHNYNF